MTAVTMKKSEVERFSQDLRFSLYGHFKQHGVDEVKVIIPLNSDGVYFRSVVNGRSFSTSMPKRDEVMRFIKFKESFNKTAEPADAWECG